MTRCFRSTSSSRAGPIGTSQPPARTWLYPERHVSKSNWTDFGHGYLFMPDPRGIHAGGGMVLQFEGGATEAYDMFGRRPSDPGYDGDVASSSHDTLRNFEEEFAGVFG